MFNVLFDRPCSTQRFAVLFCLQDIILNGHSASQIINQLHDLLLNMDDVTDKQKSVIMERLAVRTEMLLLYYMYSRVCMNMYMHVHTSLDVGFRPFPS